MPGKIDIYNLGEQGVDLVKSPLHQADGDLIQSQNGMPDPAGLEGGIRKRDGLAKLNTVALTGAIEGLQHVPLPAPGTRTYYHGQGEQGGVTPANPWYSSVGGATGWAARSTPSVPQMTGTSVFASPFSQAMSAAISYKRRFFYAGDIGAGESPVIRVWDGVTDNELCRIPAPAGSVSPRSIVAHMWVHRGYLYCTCDGAVFRIDIVTGETLLVGDEPLIGGGLASFGLSFLDRVWVGLRAGGALTTGRMVWIRNGEVAFSSDHDAAAGQDAYSHGCIYLGDLFVGTYASATAALVERRATSNGAWSTSLTGPDPGHGNFTCFAVFDGNLFCVHRGTSMLVKKFDGATWSTDLDILGAGHAHALPCGVLVENDALYIAFSQPTAADSPGYVLRRTLAGAWTNVTGSLPDSNGMIVFLP